MVKWSTNDVKTLRNAAATLPATKTGAPWKCTSETCFPGKFDATQVRNYANRIGLKKCGGGLLSGSTSSGTKRKAIELETDLDECDGLALEEQMVKAKSDECTTMSGLGLAPHEIEVPSGVWLVWNKTHNTKVNLRVEPRHHVVVVTLESRPPVKDDLPNFGRGKMDQAKKDRCMMTHEHQLQLMRSSTSNTCDLMIVCVICACCRRDMWKAVKDKRIGNKRCQCTVSIPDGVTSDGCEGARNKNFLGLHFKRQTAEASELCFDDDDASIGSN